MRRPLLLLLLAAIPLAAPAQRQGKQTARDLFYSEAGLIVSAADSRKGRFSGARKSQIAVTLGLKYRLWKLEASEPAEIDPAGPFRTGDQIRLGLETNDTGYLYIVHRQPGGAWQRLFPTPEIERGSHFIRSGVVYPVPPEEGLELQFPGGMERVFLVLSREPVRELETLVGPRLPENTVSAAPPPEISEVVVEKVRAMVHPRDLISERVSGEKAVYVVNRTGKPESLIVAEVRLNPTK